MLRLVEKTDAREEGNEHGSLDELAREGARRMLVKALEAEVAGYLERHADERDASGHALVVRNGRARPRRVTLGSGTIEIQAPRVNDRRRDARGERQRFTSSILPPYMRRSPKVAEVLPILYLRGLSTGDFRPALQGLLGEKAAGLSPTNITRLTAEWEEEYQEHRSQSLAEKDYVYVWALGVEGLGDGSDKLVTIDANPKRPTYGKVIATESVGGRHEAHHGGFTDDRRYLWMGGLDGSPIYVFDVASDPAKPKLVKTIDSFEKDSGGVVGPHTFFALPGRQLISGLSNSADKGGKTALVEYNNNGEYVQTIWMPAEARGS